MRAAAPLKFYRRWGIAQNQQSDFSATRLEFYFVHHWKRSISSRADHEALALPG